MWPALGSFFQHRSLENYLFFEKYSNLPFLEQDAMTAADKKIELAASAARDGKTSARGKLPAEIGTDYDFKRSVVWKNALGFLVLHLLALYGVYLCFYAHTATILWSE